jgi:hypothetical protein
VSRWLFFLWFTLCSTASGFAIAYSLVPHWLAMSVVGSSLFFCWVVMSLESFLER